MARTYFQIAIEVDRILSLHLSNAEFETLAEFIGDSADPEQTAKNILLCGEKAVWNILKV